MLLVPRLVRSLIVALLLGTLGWMLADTPARAATIQVTTTADEFNDPGPDTGCSLREAIQAANTDAAFGGCPAGSGDDTIDLPDGTYTLTRPGANEDANATGDLDIHSNITLTGAGAASTIIDANHNLLGDRVLQIVASVTVTLSGVTIEGGNLPYTSDLLAGGGGINNAGTLTVTDCIITNNVGYYGGGIDNSGTVTLTRTEISNDYGQGVDLAVINVGVMSLSTSSVSHNPSGGIYSSGTLRVMDSSFIDNSGDQGGGIWNQAQLTIMNSTFTGNSSRFGAAVYTGSTSAAALIANSTFANNSATGGGGIATGAGTLTITNSTFSGNSGHAIAAGEGTLRLRATILNDGAAGGNCSGTIVTFGSNVADDASCFANSGTDQVVANVGLGPLQSNGGPTQTQALNPTSPAIEAVQGPCTSDGTAGGTPITTDQRGVARPQGARCDAGAFEFVTTNGVLQFSSATYSGAEAGGAAAITVTRTGPTAGAVGATVTLTDGTATAPADYSNAPLTVSFADGEGGSKTVQVPIVDDTLYEPSETINLRLVNPTGGAVIGAPATAVLTILDNDPAPTPPPAACAPRPPVTVTSVISGDGRLQVTVTAGTAAPNDANRLRELRFQASTNALIDVAGQTGRTGAFTVTLATQPTSVTFFARRATAGQATTVPFTVADSCGDWPTFVGGGSTAGF